MTDSSDARDGERQPGPPKPARPRSARKAEEAGADGRARKRARGSAKRSGGGKARDEGNPRAAKPTPVRAMAAVEAPPPPVPPDLEEAEVTVDEIRWTIRVVGRAGGARPSDTPLLLLGFWPEGALEGDRAREAMVVGRSLAGMTPAALEDAVAASAPPVPRRDPSPESSTGRRRSRGGRGRKRGS